MTALHNLAPEALAPHNPALHNPERHNPGPTTADATQLRDTLLTTLAERHQWEQRIRFNPDDRWYQRLIPPPGAAAFDGELWLISWLPGQSTGLHDHGDSAGAFVLVDGELTEEFADVTPSGLRLIEATRRVGTPRSFGHHYLHNVTNTSGSPAVSLHTYTPKLSYMTTYTWGEAGPEALRVQRAGADW